MDQKPPKVYALKSPEELEAGWAELMRKDKAPVDWDLHEKTKSIVDFFKAGPGGVEGDVRGRTG